MFTGLLHLHNLLRYAIVILLVIALIKSFAGWFGKKEYTAADNKISLFLLISAHLQLLIGLGLYFISPVVKEAMTDMGAAMKDAVLRFWATEHLSAMILGIILITLGRIMGKKGKNDTAKFRRQAIYFLLATVLIFSAIPWPWAEMGIARPWF
ncbi:MAG: cytochrome B [Bacteroidetes bacterium]|nr:MAG: cytochrome B [Bacteroidota bacterium]MBL1143413.1 cytochrome B [Bacteroidota bacterium]NOG56217.1 cytochrome B [Bacteroidota bacterium]